MSLPLQKHNLSYQYNGETIPFSVWSTSDVLRAKTIVFLGTVQIGKLPEWIAQSCPADTVVVQGAPHWLAKEDGTDIPVFMHLFSEEAFKAIFKTYNAQRVHIIADSQAVPGVLRLVSNVKYARDVDKITLLQPLGLNAEVFGSTARERTVVFKKRITQNFKYQITSLLFDRRLLHNHRQLLLTVGYDNAKSNAQYSAGLAYDATQDLKAIYAMRKKVVIICGGNDMIFPSKELQGTLRANQLNIPIVVVPGVPHSPLATRLGIKLLNKALEHF